MIISLSQEEYLQKTRVRRFRNSFDCSMVFHRCCVNMSIIFESFWHYFSIVVRYRFWHRCLHRFFKMLDPKWFPKSSLSTPYRVEMFPQSPAELAQASRMSFVASFRNMFSTSIWASICNRFGPNMAPLIFWFGRCFKALWQILFGNPIFQKTHHTILQGLVG